MTKLPLPSYFRPTYCSQYQTIYNSFGSKPSIAVAIVQNTFVKTLVDGGVWSLLDVMWVFAAHNATDALKNWITPASFLATNVHSTAHVAYEGFTSDGANDYINLNWNPHDDGVNYTLDNCCVGTYIRTNEKADLVEVGCGDGTNYIMIQAAYNNGVTSDFYLRLNSLSYILVFNTNNASGMKIITRIAGEGADSCPSYNNKVQYLPETDSSAIPDLNMYALCWNLSGTASDFSFNQESLIFAGALLNQAKVNIITNAFEAMMDSDAYGNKGVIA